MLVGGKALIVRSGGGLLVLVPMNSHNPLEGHGGPLLNQGNHLCHRQEVRFIDPSQWWLIGAGRRKRGVMAELLL